MAKNKFDETVENHLTEQILKGEYTVAQENQHLDNEDFLAYVDMMDAVRSDKDYDWMSDISIPEFASEMLSALSDDISQYFQTRDFVEVYLEDEGDEAKFVAAANKELINRTLNRKDLHHYMKFLRARLINRLGGRVYAKCQWRQELETQLVGYDVEYEETDYDVYGEPLTNETQVPAQREIEVPVYDEVPVTDQFEYDAWDQRNVFVSNEYVYSLQNKKWVIFRSEMSKAELEEVADQNGYFNLDLLGDERDKTTDGKMSPPRETETSKGSYNYEKKYNPETSKAPKKFDILERYGKYWVRKTPTGILKPGIDRFGQPTKDSRLEEVIITVAVSGAKSVLIGFKLTPYLDAMGKPYRPITRGICYIHPTNDGGCGDGKYCRELQIGIDDTFNISQDRTMLATLPTLKVKRDAFDDNSTVYIEPGHNMECEDPQDIQELMISDNIQGALQQIGVLQDKMRQVTGKTPGSISQVPELASTTATAVAEAARGSDKRTNLQSLTFEHTFLTDLYWFITQMTYQFAHPETGFKLMGDKVYDFDPTRDYYYKPLSQTIETEQSKWMKRKEWTQILQTVVQIPHPDTVVIANKVLYEIFKLMGDEQQNFADKFYGEDVPIQQQQATGMGGSLPAGGGPAVSNQNMLPMSGTEMGARESASAGYY